MWPLKVMVRSWCNRVHSWYGVDSIWYAAGRIPQSHSISSFCVHCILYIRIHLVDFMFLLYIAQSRQSARLFSSRPNWDSLAPSTAGECVPSPFGSGGGTLACGWGGHFTELMWPRKVTLRNKKNQHKVTLTSQCDFKKVIKRRLKTFC